MDNETKPKTEKTGPEVMSAFDFKRIFEQYKFPGVDFSALVEREKKNIEALAQANKIAFEGWQALVRRQSEIFQETMAQAVTRTRQDAMKHPGDFAKQSFEKALDNMRELAEMTAKTQKAAFEVVSKRVDENMEHIRKLGKK
jgi:phasin family protein